jgi:hypothetical protein
MLPRRTANLLATLSLTGTAILPRPVSDARRR